MCITRWTSQLPLDFVAYRTDTKTDIYRRRLVSDVPSFLQAQPICEEPAFTSPSATREKQILIDIGQIQFHRLQIARDTKIKHNSGVQLELEALQIIVGVSKRFASIEDPDGESSTPRCSSCATTLIRH